MRIALTVIATGDYLGFIPGLLWSVRRYWTTDVTCWVFGDREPPRAADVRWCRVEHEPWPGPTLHRYHHLAQAINSLACFDYVFHCDADLRFVQPVGDEVLGSLTATIHQGFAGRARDEFTYESRPQSAAWIAPGEGTAYYAGGFQGGSGDSYLAAVEELRRMIDLDDSAGLTARWHDESHWNSYLVRHPPDVVLPAGWLSCETKRRPESVALSLYKRTN